MGFDLESALKTADITEKQYNAIELLVGKPTPYDKPQQFEQLMIF